jgi:hypothetical protein
LIVVKTLAGGNPAAVDVDLSVPWVTPASRVTVGAPVVTAHPVAPLPPMSGAITRK